jgi:hypothetical protein
VKSRLVLVAAVCLGLAACQSLPMPKVWPFYKKPKPGPEAVQELNLVRADGSAADYPQYWKRNTLVVDLSGVSGEGGIAARLPEETTWPVRMAVRVRPGSVGQLEVQGEERNVLPVIASGADVVDIELASSVYTPATAAIYISWGPQLPAVESVPRSEEPAFVSPTEVPSARDIVPPSEAAPTQSDPGATPGEIPPAQPSPPGS